MLKSYSSVYGPLGLVPLVLVWIYTAWVLVLLGAEITHALQNLRLLEAEDRRQRDEEPINGLLAAQILAAVAATHEAGGAGPPQGAAGDRVRPDPGQHRAGGHPAEGARPHRRGARRPQRLRPGPRGRDHPARGGAGGLPLDRHRDRARRAPRRRCSELVDELDEERRSESPG